MDLDEPKKPRSHELGMPLDTLSVEELSARIGVLEAEIVRLKGAIAKKQDSRNAAEAMFKF